MPRIDFIPPAIVQPGDERLTANQSKMLAKQVKELHEAEGKHGLKLAHDAGKVLQAAHDFCVAKGIPWQGWVEENGCWEQRRCDEFRQIFRNWDLVKDCPFRKTALGRIKEIRPGESLNERPGADSNTSPGAIKAARKKAKEKRKSKKLAPTEAKDIFGQPIPQGLLDTWKDSWINDAQDELAILSEEFRNARLIDGLQARAKQLAFIDSKDFAVGCGLIMQYLDDLLEHVKANRPAAVCPKCSGDRCTFCRQSGLVPESVYKSVNGEANA